ncbi:hypothetical protein SAMN02744133_1087 [Thalassospira xiamenensis M-5 = DSM 17429]|uniref:hypothetical protein n=1 Tax=Thalassospira xiamenensis TaxID=220697 RepID=UPI0009559BFD|nr:hypothetical protein [Thalassospira xiamenensis]SIT20817.1 hypothetical protein SAMN02744133_1087 [Thalassospira xiamenensis M-5 = DSM 17429]
MSSKTCHKRSRTARYSIAVIWLWCCGKINWMTAVYAIKKRPLAVAGRGAHYFVLYDEPEVIDFLG